MADDTKSAVEAANAALANLREAIAKAGSGGFKGLIGSMFNRFPSGTSKGGQFAPKGAMGGGSGEGVGDPSKMHNVPNPGAVPHPQKNDKGDTVHVNYPSKPSAKETWADPASVATFVPGQGGLPDALNGIKFTDAKTSDYTKGANPKVDADHPFTPSDDRTKSIGAGVIIMEDDGRIWLTKPTNEFGGYKNTFPKGTVEPQLTMQQNAIKEAFEETGLQIKITGLVGDFERTTSKARFYMAKRVGGSPKNMGWESQAVRLAPMKAAWKLLNRDVDKDIMDAITHLQSFKKMRLLKSWEKQARWPAGSPLGGQWKAMGADGLTVPPVIANGLGGKNPAYQKAMNAAHSMAQHGDLVGAEMALKQYQKQADKFAAGDKSSSHVKWGAGVHQYATELKANHAAKLTVVAAADKITGPKKLSSLGKEVAPKNGGSNPGGMYVVDGKSVMVKGNLQMQNGTVTKEVNDMRAHNEVLAAKLLNLAGVPAPEMGVVELEGKYGGGLGVTSQMMGGLTKLNPNNAAHVAAAQADFAVQAWIGNWDALGTGFDNTMIDANGKAVCIDAGGALLFRAQGVPKNPSDPTDGLALDAVLPKNGQPGDFMSMRSSDQYQKAIYGKMTSEQLANSAEKLKAISMDAVNKLVDAYGPGDQMAKDKMKARLLTRRNSILNHVAMLQSAQAKVDGIPGLPSNQAGPKPVPSTNNAPAPKHNIADAKSSRDLQLMVKDIVTPNAAKHANHTPIKPTKINKAAAMVIEMLYKDGDAKGLADVAIYNKEALKKESDPKAIEQMKASMNYSIAHLAKLTGKNIVEANATPAAVASTSKILPKPKFNTGFKTADAAYEAATAAAAAAHAMGDMDALKGMANTSNTAAGQTYNAYHQSLVNDLETKQAALTMVGVKKAEAALSQPAPVPSPQALTPPPNGAMPNFQMHKIDPSNTNASSHNPKLMKLEALALNGDVKGILSLKYGSNTYAKKEVKLANAALAALGSPHQVSEKQAANSHPALYGGATQAEAQAASLKTKTPLPPQSTAPEKVAADQAATFKASHDPNWLKIGPGEKLIDQGESFGVKWASIETPAKGFIAADIPAAPDFYKNGSSGPTGSWKSSKAEVNDSNNATVNELYALATNTTMPFDAKMKALESYQVKMLAGATVAITDAKAPAAVKEYHAQVTAELKAQMKPGVKTIQSGSFNGAYEHAANTMAKVYSRVDYKDFKQSQRAADFVVLSKDGAANLPVPQPGVFKEMSPQQNVYKDYKAKSIAAYQALTSSEKSAASAYTGSSYSNWNDALRNGSIGTHHWDSAQPLVKGMAKASVSIPKGTILWRGVGVGKATFDSVVGGIIQDGSFNSSSYGDKPAFAGQSTWLRIHVATDGFKGMDATNFSNFGKGEREIIIQNNIRYAVVKVEQHKVFTTSSGEKHHNKTIVDVIALPHDT